jgi:undecaprenyl pyrophosphate phosphatase UppP
MLLGVVVGIVLVAGLIITALGTIAANWVLWGTASEQFQRWRTMPGDARRRGAIRGAVLIGCLVALMAVLIAAPFGPDHTVEYLFGGFAVLLFVYLNGYVIWLVRRNARKR